jgi:DNA-binding CsgD family transcriptional regulator
MCSGNNPRKGVVCYTRVPEKEVLRLRAKGLTQKEIAKKLHCGGSTVCDILKRNGVHTFRKKKILDVKEILIRKNSGQTYRQISQALGCHQYSVPHAIKRALQKGKPTV